jgi:hypothetical protein
MASRLVFMDGAIIHFAMRLKEHEHEDPRPTLGGRSILQLINENTRSEWPDSAIERRVKRGNRDMWGKLAFTRLGNRKAFAVSDLDQWFDDHVLPILRGEAEARAADASFKRMTKRRLAMAGKKTMP